jgi:hypothetical protein
VNQLLMYCSTYEKTNLEWNRVRTTSFRGRASFNPMSSATISAMSTTTSSTSQNSYLTGKTLAVVLAGLVRFGGKDGAVAAAEPSSAVSLNWRRLVFGDSCCANVEVFEVVASTPVATTPDVLVNGDFCILFCAGFISLSFMDDSLPVSLIGLYWVEESW